MAAAFQSESPQAAKRGRLDTNHEDGSSIPLSSVDDREWMFVDSSHPNKVLEGLNRLRLNTTLCDVILCSEGQEFPCHRYVLASFSPYFEAMFTSGMVESTHERVTISGVEPQMIGLLVNYAYTSKVSISTANVQALLAASNLLDVAAVRQACCDYMMRHMDINNCVAVYCFAESHSCKSLEKHSLDHILQHFSVIYQQEEFLSLSVERLTDIFASDHLNVPKEDMVFEAAMLWLAKCPTRKQNFEKVLEQIRLPLISPSYINTVMKSLEVVKENQGCQKRLSEFLSEDWFSLEDRSYCNLARPRRTTVIMVLGARAPSSQAPNPRVESFDPLSDLWMTLGELPLKVHGHAAVTSGSFLYLAGGFKASRHTGTGSREVWRYDVDLNSWLKMAPMNEARFHLRLVMLDGYMFAVGGQGGNKSEDSLDRYHPMTNTWQLKESVGVAAYADGDDADYIPATVVALDGRLYFIGGMSPHKKIKPHVAKYNPETSVLTEVAPMQVRRNDPAACVLNGKIYVSGGNVGYPYRIMARSMECYSPKTNQWTMCASMPVERYMHSAVAVDGNIYVLGGRDDKDRYTKDIERYCEETNTWETVGKMLYGRYKLVCLSLRVRKDRAPVVPSPVVFEDDENEKSDSYDEDYDYYGNRFMGVMGWQ